MPMCCNYQITDKWVSPSNVFGFVITFMEIQMIIFFRRENLPSTMNAIQSYQGIIKLIPTAID